MTSDSTNEVLVLAYEAMRSKYPELQLPVFEIPVNVFQLRMALVRCPSGTLEAEKAIRSWLNVWQKSG